jgi:hypothetical protein
MHTQVQIDVGMEVGSDGHLIGRDPREMTLEELRALGHDPMPVLDIIRARCVDCAGGSPGEVRKCMALSCVSWPYRMGTNPGRAPRSQAQREQARTLAKARRKSEKAPSLGGSSDGSPSAAHG